jgi:hypothetical protein
MQGLVPAAAGGLVLQGGEFAAIEPEPVADRAFFNDERGRQMRVAEPDQRHVVARTDRLGVGKPSEFAQLVRVDRMEPVRLARFDVIELVVIDPQSAANGTLFDNQPQTIMAFGVHFMHRFAAFGTEHINRQSAITNYETWYDT